MIEFNLEDLPSWAYRIWETYNWQCGNLETLLNEEETIKDFDLNGVWYTLDGRQIQGIPGQKGIYIKNGKKIIIK